MMRSLVCVHCGLTVELEIHTQPVDTPLSNHLRVLHRDVVEGAPLRWAGLLEHFRVVPSRYLSIPRVVVVQA